MKDTQIEMDFGLCEVQVYAHGLFCCSVCAPPYLTPFEVETEVSKLIGRSCRISEDTTFSDGETVNGGLQDCVNGRTRHWLLEF